MHQTKHTLSCLILSLLYIFTQTATINNTPFVGIVTIPAEEWSSYKGNHWSYFAASYVKFLESAGAQVIAVPWDLPTDQLDALMGQLNGILFTGGSTVFQDHSGNPTPIYNVFQHIVHYVLEQNENGDYYPLWGTCQGFEIIARVLANNTNILQPCDDCRYVNKNNFPVQEYSSKMLDGLPADLQQKITDASISTFDQVWKLNMEDFSKYPTLAGNVTPVAYTYDQMQVPYISMYESPTYPIYATQFHQEKSTFEWKPSLNIVHDVDAIRFEQFLANFFVGETRKSTNTFSPNETYLIDNYNATRVPDSDFMEVYLFPAYKGSYTHGPAFTLFYFIAFTLLYYITFCILM